MVKNSIMKNIKKVLIEKQFLQQLFKVFTYASLKSTKFLERYVLGFIKTCLN